MTPELHQKAKQLFLAVCDLDETSRRKLLEEQQRVNPQVSAEVESLLRFHDTMSLIESPSTILFPPGGTTLTTSSGSTMAPSGARWVAGTVVAGRYRIINLLGKGGMGEVYSAQDLKLQRQVALKFMRPSVLADPLWLGRVYTEARIASTVTHRHVCRIFDIGESNGEVFISMEFVAGESLASLLRRVGSLKIEKALEIARQICAGLGAVHDAGVIHRDLKPANVMIDEQGNARLTDFGIAVDPGSRLAAAELAGTPGYIAPEILKGQPATIQSDLFSLGVLLYELLTARQPFDGSAAQDSSAVAITPPSNLVPEIPSTVEQAVLDCLHADPALRPRSVHEVLAAIVGQDVLAMMAAAGQTPPVELVAGLGAEVPRSKIISVSALAIAVLALAGSFLLAEKTRLLSPDALAKSPEMLAQTADRILEEAGLQLDARHVHREYSFLRSDWKSMRGQPSTLPPTEWICFRTTLVPSAHSVTSANANFVELDLNGSGQLRSFRCDPNLLPPLAGSLVEPDWSRLFAHAGLILELFQPTEPSANLRLAATTAYAWEAKHPAKQSAFQVEAASSGSSPILFKVTPRTVAPASLAHKIAVLASDPPVLSVLFLVAIVGSAPLAWRNIVCHRSDRRGAAKVGLLVFALQLLLWVFQQSHPAGFRPWIQWLIAGVQTGLFMGFVAWIYYVAIEPYLRRSRPESLVGWTRGCMGRGRDDLVGRDILIGVAFGSAVVFVLQLLALLGLHSAVPVAAMVAPPLDFPLGQLHGFSFTVTSLADAALRAVERGLLVLTLLTLVRLVLTNIWAARIATGGIVILAYVISAEPIGVATWLGCVVLGLGGVLLLDCYGLLALVVSLFVTRILFGSPLTLDPQVWYAGQSALIATMLASLLAWGAWTTLAKFAPRF